MSQISEQSLWRLKYLKTSSKRTFLNLSTFLKKNAIRTKALGYVGRLFYFIYMLEFTLVDLQSSQQPHVA